MLAHLLGNPERGTLLCNLQTLGNAQKSQKPSQESLSGKGTVLKDLISIFFHSNIIYNYISLILPGSLLGNLADLAHPAWKACGNASRGPSGNYVRKTFTSSYSEPTPELFAMAKRSKCDLERVGYQPREANWSDLQLSKLQQVLFPFCNISCEETAPTILQLGIYTVYTYCPYEPFLRIIGSNALVGPNLTRQTRQMPETKIFATNLLFFFRIWGAPMARNPLVKSCSPICQKNGSVSIFEATIDQKRPNKNHSASGNPKSAERHLCHVIVRPGDPRLYLEKRGRLPG